MKRWIYSRVLASVIGLALSNPSFAQPYDGTGDCQTYATAFYKARDPDFRSFVIDRNTVEESAYEENVGTQHVTAIFRGRATYTDRRGRRTSTFICLHAGSGKGALFVYLFPH
jgi:hypothetical protein